MNNNKTLKVEKLTIINAKQSLINSLAPESDKSSITYNAYQSYTYGTKTDISACLPEAFSGRYCNLRG